MGNLAQLGDELFPLLIQLGREKRIEQRRQRRTRTIQLGVQTIFNKNASEEDKRRAYAELAAAGNPVPLRYVQPRPDLSWAKLPPSVQQAYDTGILTAEEALKTGLNKGAQIDINPETMDKVAKTLGLSVTGEQLVAMHQLSKYLGGQQALQVLKASDGDSAQMMEITDAIDRGVRFENLKAADRAFLLKKFSTREKVNMLFNKKGDASKLWKWGQQKVQAGLQALLGPDMPPVMAMSMWRDGKLTGGLKAVSDYLAKYFDKATLEIKPDAIIDGGVDVYDMMKKIENSINGVIPPSIEPILISLFEQGITTREQFDEELKKAREEATTAGKNMKYSESTLAEIRRYLQP